MKKLKTYRVEYRSSVNSDEIECEAVSFQAALLLAKKTWDVENDSYVIVSLVGTGETLVMAADGFTVRIGAPRGEKRVGLAREK